MAPDLREGSTLKHRDKRFEVHGTSDIEPLSFIATVKPNLAQLCFCLYSLGGAGYAGPVGRSDNRPQDLALRFCMAAIVLVNLKVRDREPPQT